MDDMIFSTGKSPEKVVLIEYHRGSRRRWLPFNVETIDIQNDCLSIYDFEYCEDTGLGWYESGGGGEIQATISSGYKKEIDTKLWVAPGIPIKLMLWRGKKDKYTYHDITPTQMRRRGYELLAKPLPLFKEKKINPFDVSEGTDNGFIWCKICDKNFIRDDMAVCEHLRWCDECLAYVYPDHSSEDSSTPVIHKESA